MFGCITFVQKVSCYNKIKVKLYKNLILFKTIVWPIQGSRTIQVRGLLIKVIVKAYTEGARDAYYVG